MKTSIRRKLGIVLAVLAVTAVVILTLAGVPLLSHSTRVISTSPGATVTDEATRVHWPLVPPAIVFMLGAVLIAISRHDNVA